MKLRSFINHSVGAVPIKDPKKRRKCPECGCNLFLYYINHEEMFLMCEDSCCEFPFGIEPIQIVFHESELEDKPPNASADFFEYPVGGVYGIPATPLGSDITSNFETSTIPSSCFSECEEYSINSESEASIYLVKQETLPVKLSKQGMKRKQLKYDNKEMENNLNSIKELNEEMHDLMDNVKNISHYNRQIKNKKWLNNLNLWESRTGKKLLREDEKIMLQECKPQLPNTEVKIFMESEGTIPSVNIEISNTVKDENVLKIEIVKEEATSKNDIEDKEITN